MTVTIRQKRQAVWKEGRRGALMLTDAEKLKLRLWKRTGIFYAIKEGPTSKSTNQHGKRPREWCVCQVSIT
jgi:hypothetical protein